MKKKNRLLDFDMIIYQDDEWFAFSLDSVLLSNFVSVKLTDKKILDMCKIYKVPQKEKIKKI